MSAKLPDRFRAEVRLGRYGAAEAWLATDTALDRPVLLRVVGSDVAPKERRAFLDAVRAAAGINHVHVAEVYAADETEEGVYAVTEWAGGVTIGDRMRAGEPIAIDDFLPNAAGLADALAEFHLRDIVHGAVGPDTILYSTAHPAKLTGFGRNGGGSSAEDTAALANALRTGLAGGPTDLSPSQVAQGLSPSIDRALSRAEDRSLDAAGLAAALRAAPSVRQRRRRPGWSWRWVVPAALLMVGALGMVALGFAIDVQDDSPFLFPAGPAPPATTAPPATSPPDQPAVAEPTPGQVGILEIEAYDPFGDESEHGDNASFAIDGAPATAWRTERYFDPLPLIKPGVGLVIEVQGTPARLELAGTSGTAFTLYWAPERPPAFDRWDEILTASLSEAGDVHLLPGRDGGAWLVWLTDLPVNDEGFYLGELHEVRFSA